MGLLGSCKRQSTQKAAREAIVDQYVPPSTILVETAANHSVRVQLLRDKTILHKLWPRLRDNSDSREEPAIAQLALLLDRAIQCWQGY